MPGEDIEPRQREGRIREVSTESRAGADDDADAEDAVCHQHASNQ